MKSGSNSQGVLSLAQGSAHTSEAILPGSGCGVVSCPRRVLQLNSATNLGFAHIVYRRCLNWKLLVLPPNVHHNAVVTATSLRGFPPDALSGPDIWVVL